MYRTETVTVLRTCVDGISILSARNEGLLDCACASATLEQRRASHGECGLQDPLLTYLEPVIALNCVTLSFCCLLSRFCIQHAQQQQGGGLLSAADGLA